MQYIDLANSAPVASFSFTGGLVEAGLYEGWSQGDVAVLIDGLDEARLRATQDGFEAFLNDVAKRASGRRRPIVVFGRTNAIQDAWVTLNDAQISVRVLEIGFYSSDESLKFGEKIFGIDSPNNSHRKTQADVLRQTLERLRARTSADGNRFSGYAPVIQAVCRSITKLSNPSEVLSDQSKLDTVTLSSVVSHILQREHSKVYSINFTNPSAKENLYKSDEQLLRLSSLMFGTPEPEISNLNAADLETYNQALASWVAEHPFLDGNGRPSSSVFEAAITVFALKRFPGQRSIIQKELSRGSTANPFISEFYFDTDSSSPHIPLEHIGVLYASIRARLASDEQASLHIEPAEDTDQEQDSLGLICEVETFRSGDARSARIEFKSDQSGTLLLGSYVEDIDVSMPLGDIFAGYSTDGIFVSPINIQCRNITLGYSRIACEGRSGIPAVSSLNNVINIEAEHFEGSEITSPPQIRGAVSFLATWPGNKHHPWTSFAAQPREVDDPALAEALRRFRKFIIAFRSHSKGSLARLQAKLDHSRMTKGSGRAVLDHLLKNSIIYIDTPMYKLDAKKLSEVAGADYLTTISQTYNEKTIDFVALVIKNRK